MQTFDRQESMWDLSVKGVREQERASRVLGKKNSALSFLPPHSRSAGGAKEVKEDNGINEEEHPVTLA